MKITRDELLIAAFKLFMSVNYEKASFAELGKMLGMSKAGIFKYYKNIRRLRNVPALLHIGINQRADYWHQFHQQLLQMHRVSFSFDNDNNEKEKI